MFQTHKTSGDGRGWVDELSIPYFSSNVSSYIAISPIREGNFGKSFKSLCYETINLTRLSGHYRHLIHVQISKKRIIPLTHGRFDCNKIVHWVNLIKAETT